jgi:GT2 family glycosyltransferase
MQPMPNDFFNFWYFKLIYYSLSLGNAGIIACNLLYPKNSKPQDGWFVQSGGGGFDKNKINLIGGGGKENPKISYTEDLKVVREVEWVTFGGILIQRRLLRTCGKFDSIYKWAFVMDVDYSLNARLAGFNLYQVPVSLIHEESKTTSSFMKQNQIYARFYKENHTKFDKKWGKILENWNQFDSYL